MLPAGLSTLIRFTLLPHTLPHTRYVGLASSNELKKLVPPPPAHRRLPRNGPTSAKRSVGFTFRTPIVRPPPFLSSGTFRVALRYHCSPPRFRGSLRFAAAAGERAPWSGTKQL